jgi:ornithine decarboxylase
MSSINKKTNIDIYSNDDIDEYLSLLLYPISTTLNKFLKRKLSNTDMIIEKEKLLEHPEQMNLELVEIFYKLFKTSLKETTVYPLFHTNNIKKIINYYISKIIINTEAFYLVNLMDIKDKYRNWLVYFPLIRPYYAMKCNPDEKLVSLLIKEGAGVDCASMEEIKIALRCGAHPESIIYANPIKSIEYLLFAKDHGINLMTFDSIDELKKIHTFYPETRIILRIKTDDKKAKCKLSIKFGMEMHEIPNALNVCKTLNLNLVGVSFHMGSSSTDITAFMTALDDSRYVFDTALDYGFHLSILDIGGGLTIKTAKEFYTKINNKIDDLFLKEQMYSNIKLISEPGRFFLESSHVLVLNIIGKKNASESENQRVKYYLNDGIYGGINNKEREQAIIHIKMLKDNETPEIPSIFFGPTCDSYDTIANDILFPECYIGEWVYVENMGAYSKAGACDFNGFPKSISFYYTTI